MSGWFQAALALTLAGILAGSGAYFIAVRQTGLRGGVGSLVIGGIVMTGFLGLAILFALTGIAARYLSCFP
ncbi:MAG: hypothetical protein LCH95_13915 [Proteobacteria bacterium]|nr:hypothetical protein [Pseudomonadota bacterium]